ncbi:MAG: pentapeptide repeat-containing protein [Thermoguttaceae bacterium]|nr:pentapeptide repeat-containing protein [Thermoguttaceae bacterium]MBR4104333.1 pentapeptide repeat-containing protein [Thermoguttaceae bacterium]
MKRQRFFLAAVATCAFLASCAVPVVCLGQSDIETTELGKNILEQSVPTNPLTDDLDDDSRLAQSTHIACIARIPYDNPELIKLAFGLDLTEHNLIGSKITNVTLKDVNFTACDLTGADLRQAYFVRCNFSRAVLRDVKIDEYTRFIDCKFDGASFGGYDVQLYPREPFDASLLTEEQLKSTDYFSKKSIPAGYVPLEFQGNSQGWGGISTMAFKDCADYDFTDIALQGEFRNLTAEQLKQTQNFKFRFYEHIVIGDGRGQRLDYRNFDFSKSIFCNCYLRNVDLTGADFTDAAFYECSLPSCGLTLEQMKSTWNWKAGRMDLIKLPPELQAQVDAQIAKEAAQATEAQTSPETE